LEKLTMQWANRNTQSFTSSAHCQQAKLDQYARLGDTAVDTSQT